MKQVFVLIHLLLLTAAACVLVQTLYAGLLSTQPDFRVQLSGRASLQSDSSVAGQSLPAAAHQQRVIAGRNLFGISVAPDAGKVDKPAKQPETPVKDIVPTTLALKLWGTVTGGSVVYAVIEDTKTRKQALYREGEAVQQAVVKQILPNRVILHHDGKDQVLEMETVTDKGPVGATESFQPQTAQTIVMGSASGAFPEGQVKGKPHYLHGVPDGLLLYGIQPESPFAMMGLNNGDILREVNDNPVVGEADLALVYDEFEAEQGPVRLLVTRRGEPREIIYNAGQEDPDVTQSPDQEESKGDQ